MRVRGGLARQFSSPFEALNGFTVVQQAGLVNRNMLKPLNPKP